MGQFEQGKQSSNCERLRVSSFIQTPGRVSKISAEEDYGFIATPDGREIYFHRNSVIDNAFDRLSVGSEVRFAEELGEKGAQASTVHLIGKHHLSEQNHRR